MSYTRPPFDAADASWSGAALYNRPAHDAADATFMLDVPRVVAVVSIQTTATIPPVAVSGSACLVHPASAQVVTVTPIPAATMAARVDPPILASRGEIQTTAPIPTVSVSGAIHEFVPYVAPDLTLTLACRPYLPRPLDCAVWLDYWQPPCLRVIAGTVAIQTTAPIPPTVVGAVVHQVQLATVQITAPVPITAAVLNVQVQQDLALPDNTANGSRAVYASRSSATATRLSDRHAQAHPTRHRAHAPQQQAIPTHAGLWLPQTQMLKLRLAAMLEQQQGIRVSGFTGLPHAETVRHRESIRLPQSEAIRYRSSLATPQAERIRTRTRRLIGERQAVPVSILLQTIDQQARPTQTRLHTSQQQMLWPLPGRWWPWYEPPSLDLVLDCNPDYIARPLSCLVVMCGPQPHCPGVDPEPSTTIIIPVRRVYRVRNTVTLVRVSDGHPIDASRLSLELDAGGWTWTWSATLPAPMLDLIRVSGEPQELLATVNGESIRLRIVRIRRSRAFGSASLSVSGHGLAAVLGGRGAPTITRRNTETRTAQQLLIDALTDNGVPIGWAVDWRLEDWSVPAGAWSHTGTYIEAATRIAEAGGGYVQGHDTDPTLIIRPYYPSAPWTWGAIEPDIVMPEDVCRTDDIEWIEASDYNAVWITGSVNGRRDRIRRAGSAGDRHAPTVVDALATDEVMTRQRGIRVLGDTGRQAWVTVSLPVIEETGLIRPGQLIEYSEQGHTHLGLSRSLSVDYQFPALWQTIKLETHPS